MSSYNTEIVDAYKDNKDWIYFGGGEYHTHYDKTNGRHNRYFHLSWPHYFDEQPSPPVEERCVCNHHIEQQCYILNVKTKDIVIIGNCCILKFGLQGRKCGECGADHKNRKDNLCNDCRKKKKIKEKNLCPCGRKKKYPKYPVCVACYYNR